MIDWCQPISYCWITTKSLKLCSPGLLTQSRRCAHNKRKYTGKKDTGRFNLIIFINRTHTETLLYAGNLHASSSLVLSHCRHNICLHRLVVGPDFYYPDSTLCSFSTKSSSFEQIGSFGINLPESLGINKQWNEHTVDQWGAFALYSRQCGLCHML